MMQRFVLVGVMWLSVCGSTVAQSRRTDPAKYGWFTDYATAKAEAQRTGQPLMVVFRCEP
ncbi:MAG: thioredoxin family protein [Gemmata sp.]|nr:thioredoxin family protein [Gemmata sp.]